MNVASESDTLVEYQSDSVFVRVYHGRHSYELGIEIGLLRSPQQQRFRIPAVVNGLDIATNPNDLEWQASSQMAVRNGVSTLAEFVRKHYDDLLRANLKAFDAVEKAELRLQEAASNFYAFAAVRDKAEAAWNSKDFGAVIEYYTQLLPDIKAKELRRLEFARKRLEARRPR